MIVDQPWFPEAEKNLDLRKFLSNLFSNIHSSSTSCMIERIMLTEIRLKFYQNCILRIRRMYVIWGKQMKKLEGVYEIEVAS